MRLRGARAGKRWGRRCGRRGSWSFRGHASSLVSQSPILVLPFLPPSTPSMPNKRHQPTLFTHPEHDADDEDEESWQTSSTRSHAYPTSGTHSGSLKSRTKARQRAAFNPNGPSISSAASSAAPEGVFSRSDVDAHDSLWDIWCVLIFSVERCYAHVLP